MGSWESTDDNITVTQCENTCNSHLLLGKTKKEAYIFIQHNKIFHGYEYPVTMIRVVKKDGQSLMTTKDIKRSEGICRLNVNTKDGKICKIVDVE